MSKRIPYTNILTSRAFHDVANMVVELRKYRGEGEPPKTQRDIYVGMAAAGILAIEELDGDDNEEHGWGPK
jgi:hypothetical protein